MWTPRDHYSRILLTLALAACSSRVPIDLGLAPVLENPEDGLCIAMQFSREDPELRVAQVTAVQKLGAHLIRQDVLWANVQPMPEVWDWETEDAIVDAAIEASGDMIAMLGYGTPWASDVEGADEFYPPADPADFATFAAAAVERYGDRIRRFEIWNEPNAGFRFWKQDPFELGGDPVAYADLFLEGAQAIHAVDPSAEVLVGGLFFHEQGIPGAEAFLSDMLSARPEILDEADGVAFHPYTLYPPRHPPENSGEGEIPLVDMIAALRTLVGDEALVITEVGWPSWGDVTPEAQADWMVRAFALAQSEGVRDVCVYTLEDGEEPASDPEQAFGLFTLGAAEMKPAGEAFLALSDALRDRDAAYGRAESVLGIDEEGLFAARYGGADGATTVLWSPEGEATVSMPSSCRAADGREVEVGAAPTVVREDCTD